ncbi:hypothetical protein NL676_007148 [Syzygium grande]|nr:hypothetical protein NL676_007148 [Syzygium grande]
MVAMSSTTTRENRERPGTSGGKYGEGSRRSRRRTANDGAARWWRERGELEVEEANRRVMGWHGSVAGGRKGRRFWPTGYWKRRPRYGRTRNKLSQDKGGQ